MKIKPIAMPLMMLAGSGLLMDPRYIADCRQMDYNRCLSQSGFRFLAPAAFAEECFEEGSAAFWNWVCLKCKISG